ncbi:putative aminophospholipid-translocase [Blastocladiella emersonii ATCC 22665]|nr:putative aminophospholipid-translocase [Blastocladiella emersonii ATCC 22665]
MSERIRLVGVGGSSSGAAGSQPSEPRPHSPATPSPRLGGRGFGSLTSQRYKKYRLSDALDDEELMMPSRSPAADAHGSRSVTSRAVAGLALVFCGPCMLLDALVRAGVGVFRRQPTPTARTVEIPVLFEDRKHRRKLYAPNTVRNQKYSALSFVPTVLFEQFKFFFNLYFLLVALSQFVPALQIGYIVTYFGPLVFVLMITMAKEANDDLKRRRRDREANSQYYPVLNPTTGTFLHVPSSDLAVGDLVQVTKNQRVPADLVLLRTHDKAGSCFVRTDQLDGETDWKLRLAVPSTQAMPSDAAVAGVRAVLDAEPPSKDIHAFTGNLTLLSTHHVDPLTADNLLWMNTVLASPDPVLGCVVYTGRDTRAVMNTNTPTAKVGLLDAEVNRLSKILFAVTCVLSLAMIYFAGFHGNWAVYLVRFLILFSSIIPISLRVNLDMGKMFYARQIMRDECIEDTIVRTSTIPEELGRIEYLLSDKTGTLTRNEMEMKKVHVGTMSFGTDSFDEMAALVAAATAHTVVPPMLAVAHLGHSLDGTATMTPSSPLLPGFGQPPALPPLHSAKRGHGKTRDMSSRARDIVLALALCHNVNLIVSETDGTVSLQAASPDEIALVRWAQQMGISLVARDVHSIRLRLPGDVDVHYEILHVFPFTSESKRMGIVVRDSATGEATFLEKGADAVMARLVQYNDWLDEECGNMSREGLRTLVVARKRLAPDTLARFQDAFHHARTLLHGRNEAVQQVVAQYLERDLEILGLTGVEDKLQDDVRPTLEALRNAGIKVWMLTGDKIETATCIALSSKLVSRQQAIYTVSKVRTPHAAEEELERLAHVTDACLIIDGESLAVCLDHCLAAFLTLATRLPAVVCCRCSPTQKAQVTELIKRHTGRRVCCIGDGGNDVSMIQAAHVGVGIVGKEGRQASLAADFSVTQFSHLTRLILWHGRNSYQRSARLAQFVIHRGLIISVMQAVFSAIFYFAPIALYQGMLLVGYTTCYTMAPVFSLVLDHDVPADLALLFPELYKDLTKGRHLALKSFFVWLLVSVYQGGAIMMFALLLFDNDFVHVVSISFTALVLNELLMVALDIKNWHRYMVWAQVWTLAVYVASMAILPEFDLDFIATLAFVGKVLAITAVSSAPLFVIKRLQHHFAPPSYQKLVNHH